MAQLQDECNWHPESDHAYGVPDAEKRAKGNITRWGQTKLNGLGYNYGMIDDDFGNNTKTGVIAYQRANSFAADGIVEPKNA